MRPTLSQIAYAAMALNLTGCLVLASLTTSCQYPVRTAYRFFGREVSQPTSAALMLCAVLLLAASVAALLGCACAHAARLRKANSQPDGLCTVCGYDLRATPTRCPECGTRVRADPAWLPFIRRSRSRH